MAIRIDRTRSFRSKDMPRFYTMDQDTDIALLPTIMQIGIGSCARSLETGRTFILRQSGWADINAGGGGSGGGGGGGAVDDVRVDGTSVLVAGVANINLQPLRDADTATNNRVTSVEGALLTMNADIADELTGIIGDVALNSDAIAALDTTLNNTITDVATNTANIGTLITGKADKAIRTLQDATTQTVNFPDIITPLAGLFNREVILIARLNPNGQLFFDFDDTHNHVSGFTYNPATRVLTITKDDATTLTTTLPQASTLADGLMTTNDVTALQDVISRVDSLYAGGVWRGSFDTYADMIAAWPGLDVSTSGWNVNDFVDVIFDENRDPIDTPSTTYRVKDVSGVLTLVFANETNTSVALATNSSTGVVMGMATGDGRIFVESDGTMSVIGWDALTLTVSQKYTLPAGGIPASDLAATVSQSLGLANTAMQPSGQGVSQPTPVSSNFNFSNLYTGTTRVQTELDFTDTGFANTFAVLSWSNTDGLQITSPLVTFTGDIAESGNLTVAGVTTLNGATTLNTQTWANNITLSGSRQIVVNTNTFTITGSTAGALLLSIPITLGGNITLNANRTIAAGSYILTVTGNMNVPNQSIS